MDGVARCRDLGAGLAVGTARGLAASSPARSPAIPVYALFAPRTGTGAVLTDIHSTPHGPRYATRKDFVYGEDVTIADWTISTENLPRYKAEGTDEVGTQPTS